MIWCTFFLLLARLAHTLPQQDDSLGIERRDAQSHESFKLHITALNHLDLITVAYDGHKEYEDLSTAPKHNYTTGEYIQWGNGPSEAGRTRDQHGTIATIKFDARPTKTAPMRVLVEKWGDGEGKPEQTMNCEITFNVNPEAKSLAWWLGAGIDYDTAGIEPEEDGWSVKCTGENIEGSE